MEKRRRILAIVPAMRMISQSRLELAASGDVLPWIGERNPGPVADVPETVITSI